MVTTHKIWSIRTENGLLQVLKRGRRGGGGEEEISQTQKSLQNFTWLGWTWFNLSVIYTEMVHCYHTAFSYVGQKFMEFMLQKFMVRSSGEGIVCRGHCRIVCHAQSISSE